MAKTLQFQYQDQEIAASIGKVDRTKLYGDVEIEAFDTEGRPCRMRYLAGDGCTLIAPRGIAAAYLSPSGEWRERGQLVATDIDGNVVEPVPSSFDAPIPLDTPATLDDYLWHDIRTVYRLSLEELEDQALLEALREGSIFTFEFSYRGGLRPDTAFVLMGEDDGVYLCVGRPAELHFVGLEEAEGLTEEEEPEDEDEEDELSFDLM